MATRSTIAIEKSDGTVLAVYCHWDGYLENNGRILNTNYNDPQVLDQLINFGDISSLGEDLNKTQFYARDFDEDLNEPQVYATFHQYRKELPREEFNYILRRDGNWYVEYHGEFEGLLSRAFADAEVLDD
jgi:hypothetical protein